MVGLVLISCRYGVGDAEWAQMRALLLQGKSVAEVAELCDCRSRWPVYQARDNDVPPSQRRRAPNKPSLAKAIKARRTQVKQLIKKTAVIKGTKVLKKPGRPRKDGTPRGTYVVTKSVRKLLYPSPAAVARFISQNGTQVSEATVRRDLLVMDMKAYCRPNVPALSASEILTRLRFARWVLRQPVSFCDSLIFTDETWFDCNDCGHRFQWCERAGWKSAIAGREHTQSGPAVFAWGAISARWRLLVFVEYDGKGMNQFDYVSQCIRALKRKNLNGLMLQQDGATCHWAPHVMAELKKMKLPALERWPAHSPDLNPIEHLWSRLKRAVSQRGPFGIDELKKYVLDEFNKVPAEDITKLVLSFKTRCIEVEKNHGQVCK